jgi:type VI secretion system protein ImpF
MANPPPASRLTPSLFDKLVADLEVEGLRESAADAKVGADATHSTFRFYSVARIERFNERALRATVRRELDWILNTTNFESSVDLTAYPNVRTSVLNYGVLDLAGKPLTDRVVQERARLIRDAIRAFEPRMDPKTLDVEAAPAPERENAVTYVIRGDISAAVRALPVEFKTDVEFDTASVILRE